jgi:hypothetical protein
MTLKAYKDAIKVGTRLTVLEHWNAREPRTTRVVDKVQTSSFRYRNEGDPTPRWSPFPRSRELEFDGRIARVRLETGQHWTLRVED